MMIHPSSAGVLSSSVLGGAQAKRFSDREMGNYIFSAARYARTQLRQLEKNLLAGNISSSRTDHGVISLYSMS